MRLPRPLSLSVVILLLGGCVYYNGMYNAKRLAGSARKAERDGRNFEATSLWGQVVTRAESLVARHPDSKYVDEALVLKGVALARLNQCPSAVAPLGRASQLAADADLTEEAALMLGRCQLQLGDATLADATFARISESDDPVRRREARLLRARALRVGGQPDEALAALAELNGPRAADERLLALAGARRRWSPPATAPSGGTPSSWPSGRRIRSRLRRWSIGWRGVPAPRRPRAPSSCSTTHSGSPRSIPRERRPGSARRRKSAARPIRASGRSSGSPD